MEDFINRKEVVQVELVPSHFLLHILLLEVVVAVQDYNLMVVTVDPVVVEVDKMEMEETLHNHQLIQELLNMEIVVVVLVLMLLVVVEQAVLVNHIPIIQTEWDGVV
ncbi:MAG: hypothetical protein OXU61_06595 [Gammaproteobacteria bacterium]|nr:hypothetical protein [Gammaproteobacteria bacterium]